MRRRKRALIEEALPAGREALVLRPIIRPPVGLPAAGAFMGCGHFAQARDWLAARGYLGVI